MFTNFANVAQSISYFFLYCETREREGYTHCKKHKERKKSVKVRDSSSEKVLVKTTGSTI